MGRKSKFDSSFKAKVAIEALQEKETIQNLARKYNVSPSCIESWKDALLANSSAVFERESSDKQEVKKLKQENDILMRKVGQLTLDCDFFLRVPARMPV